MPQCGPLALVAGLIALSLQLDTGHGTDGDGGAGPTMDMHTMDMHSSLIFPSGDIESVDMADFTQSFPPAMATALNEQAARTQPAAAWLNLTASGVIVLGVSPGSLVVDFSIGSILAARLTVATAIFSELTSAATSFVVLTSAGRTYTSSTAFLRTPSMYERCVPSSCSHDDQGCHPVTCDAPTACNIVDCTEALSNSTTCFTVARPGFVNARVMCALPACIKKHCSCGAQKFKGCTEELCDGGEEADGGEHRRTEAAAHGGGGCDPCHAGHSDDGLAFWPLLLAGVAMSITFTALIEKMASGEYCGRSINPPFTVVMFMAGYLVAAWVTEDNWATSYISTLDPTSITSVLINSIKAWKGAHPHVFLFCLLPPLLFEDAASMEFYTLKKVLSASILLAGPGVLMSMFLTCAATIAVFGFGSTICITDSMTGLEDCEAETAYPLSSHLLLGGMLAATDPVAVCAVLRDLGAPDKLNFMIAGESLLNDGTAVVAFLVMQLVAGGCATSFASVVVMTVRLAGGGVLFGLLMSAFVYHFIKHSNNKNIEISSLVVGTYATFWVAESLLGVSGVLATVVYGVQTARTSFLSMSEEAHHANHAVWGEIGYIATSMIFFLAGVVTSHKLDALVGDTANLLGDLTSTDSEHGLIDQALRSLVMWVLLTLIRAFVITALSPILTKTGYGLSWKEAAVMVWGALRGAVSLSLALLVDGNEFISQASRELIFLQTIGAVSLTLLINGTTAGMVYKALEVYPPNPFRPVLATQGLRNLQREISKTIEALDSHWFHSNANLSCVEKFTPDFVGARLRDGDLVGVPGVNIHLLWSRHVTEAPRLSPIILASKIVHAFGPTAGVKMMAKAARLLHSNDTSQDEELPNDGPGGAANEGGERFRRTPLLGLRKRFSGESGAHEETVLKHHSDHDHTVDVLHNIKQWIEQASAEIAANPKCDGGVSANDELDLTEMPTFAMYEVVLSHMRKRFVHERERDLISIGGFNMLAAALGKAVDMNSAQLDDFTSHKEFGAPKEYNPVSKFIYSIIKFAQSYEKESNAISKLLPEVPTEIDTMDTVASADLELLGEEFASSYRASLQRAQAELAQMQLRRPNTWKCVHTALAFRYTCAECKGKIESFSENGFITDNMVDGLCSIIDKRFQELQQYLRMDVLWQLIGALTNNIATTGHPMVAMYKKDQAVNRAAAGSSRHLNPMTDTNDVVLADSGDGEGGED